MENSKPGDLITLCENTDIMANKGLKGSSENSVTRYNNITKSPNDTRNYRGLILPNKMKVLLISDPKTDKSAASLDVLVGYLSDPKEVPGLAHFCEHMLFHGTKKYPEVNEYNQYLSQNGGSSNAVTFADHTNYFFDVNPDNLKGALDRFSQFFIAPLFSESVTEKELNAVNSEHEKNVANDSWRLDQLERSSSNPNHPHSKFGTGNTETLEIIPKEKNINVRQELITFHNTWYSANIMALSVIGKESLDDLENIVLEMFAQVENKNVEAPKWTEHPFSKEDFKTKWCIVPIKDIRNLSIVFPIPDLNEYYRAAPAHYWAHLIGHEGEGSLLSALKKKSWVNSLVAGKRNPARGYDFFSVLVDLTEEGLLHVDDIVTMVFQYINLLKDKGPIEDIQIEYSDIANMNFRFQEKSSPRNYAHSTAQLLQEYPMEEILTGAKLTKEWRPDLISDLNPYLVPDKVRILVIAKAFEAEANSVEPWYGTKYKKEKIASDVIDKWKNAGLNKDFHLPNKNEFIPSKFDIKPYEKADKFPVIIKDTPFVRVWYKQDDEFLVPKATMSFDFVCPLVYVDPLNCNMTSMFVRLFKDSLTEYVYNADLAGLKSELHEVKYGLTLGVGGYDHKLEIFLEKILDKMVNFTIDEKRFEILKENYIRVLKNFEADQPYQHASYYLQSLLSERAWTKEEYLKSCSKLTVERVRQFIPLMLSKIHIECLVYGNITKAETLRVVQMVESKMALIAKDLTPLQPIQLVQYREIQLPNGCNYLYEMENKHHKSSCTQVYYQTGFESTENNMLLELFTQIISEPCFNILRNKEQLGYIVFSGVRKVNGVQGLRILVQSSRHPQYVQKRIEAFMKSMGDYIKDMPDSEFAAHKEALATQRLEKPKTLVSQSGVYWSEISMQQYNFDRANIEVAYLRTINRDQIAEFYQKSIYDESQSQQKMSIHVVSTAEGGESAPEKTSDENEKEAVRITDVLQFKTRHPLCPLPEPYNNVPRKGTVQSKL